MIDHESLWQKSKHLMGKALAARRRDEEEDFALYAGLALEVLAKSFLAKSHPALVADPKNEKSLLMACGALTFQSKEMRSIGAAVAFERCRLVGVFNEDTRKWCVLLADERNGHVHSGDFPFKRPKDESWQQKCWVVIDQLVVAQGRQLDELVGEAEAIDARKVIADAKAHEAVLVQQKVRRCREAFLKLGPEERTFRENLAEMNAHRVEESAYDSRAAQECPACGSTGVFRGDIIHEEELISDDGSWSDGTECLIDAGAFSCDACGLSLDGSNEVHLAGMPGEYTKIIDAPEPPDFDAYDDR